MPKNKEIICPVCKDNNMMLKYEAGYIYSYFIDNDAPGMKNEKELLPFLYDHREQKESRQYIECTQCGAQFPCFFSEGSKGMDYKDLQEAVNLNNLVRGTDNKANH